MRDQPLWVPRGSELMLVHGTTVSTIPTDVSVFLHQSITGTTEQSRTNGLVRHHFIHGFGYGHRTINAIQYVGTLKTA